ncbi:hypothetical protein B7R77_13155 [Ralstonia solanacearum K60]|uniref:Uncharacterized protein n=1 Tax=Ralstonia solanacearum K60 TaxID=1091042 RepID=A0AAP8D4T7_RALSL|nr:hypothetical protein BH759_17890 [Ralstonia solanacearum]OYQ14106.1 hypothetical protein B7R77_13155 [Ralstonia solanacearum K60]RIJ86176.1 hypothetical protein RSP822_12015 [Ralstonia solanacearum]
MPATSWPAGRRSEALAMIPMAVAADRSVVRSREVRAQRVSRVMPRADQAIHAALAAARR